MYKVYIEQIKSKIYSTLLKSKYVHSVTVWLHLCSAGGKTYSVNYSLRWHVLASGVTLRCGWGLLSVRQVRGGGLTGPAHVLNVHTQPRKVETST